MHMDRKQFVASEFNASARLLQQLAVELTGPIVQVAELMAVRLSAGNKILMFGNGGSAADAQHFAAELVGRYRGDRPTLPALALTTDTSVLTSVGNDFGFQEIFARQVKALAQPGDIVFGISTSGRSPNVIAGLQAAQQSRALTVALIGADLSGCLPVADEIISIPIEDTPRVQEAHAVIIHILCDLVERLVFKGLESES